MDSVAVESSQTAPPNAVDPARKRRRRRRGRRPGAPSAPGGSPNELANVDAKGAADDVALNGTRDELDEEDGSIVDDDMEPSDD
jgi:hypothetical protein